MHQELAGHLITLGRIDSAVELKEQSYEETRSRLEWARRRVVEEAETEALDQAEGERLAAEMEQMGLRVCRTFEDMMVRFALPCHPLVRLLPAAVWLYRAAYYTLRPVIV